MSSKRNLIAIRNLKPEINLQDSAKNIGKWSQLESAITHILNASPINISLEELYRLAEELYYDHYMDVFQNFALITSQYLHDQLKHLKLINPADDISKPLTDLWLNYCQHIQTIRNILLRYDRSAMFRYCNVQVVSSELFTNIILDDHFVRNKLVGEMLALIELQRHGHEVSDKLLKSWTEMLNYLHVYEKVFQDEFLQQSRKFYHIEGKTLISHLTISEYLVHVDSRLIEERQRTNSYLNLSTQALVLQICQQELVENHAKQILETGVELLMDRNATKELRLLYILFQNVKNGLKSVQDQFKNYVIKRGSALIDPKGEKNLIGEVIDFKDKLDLIITKCFDDHTAFHESLRLGFKTFINLHQTKTPQLLAKYVDSKMRAKDLDDERMEQLFMKIVKLFKYIQGKDIFEVFYKQYLAKRLLLGKSASQDAEHSMITKLKEECGDAFTSNIEGMFHDIYMSQTINLTFKEKQRLIEFTSDFCVFVLTNSYWPSYPNFDVNLPVELMNYQESFQKFYLSLHSGRKLFWKPNLGYCLLKANFPEGCKELQVSLFQTVVLLLFNANSQLTWKEISEMTNLDKIELKRTLLSLACGKARVLLKQPKGIEIDENEDVFALNEKFKDRLYRVKINQIQLQESVEEDLQTEKNVLVDRQYQIDAAIVRIMKNKRVIKHSQLVSDLYQVLDIPANQADLKKRIEMLIEREYMERDKENKSTYIYIA